MFFAAIQIKVFSEYSAYELFLSIFAYTVPSVFIIPFIIRYTYGLQKRTVLIICSFLRLFFSLYLLFNNSIYDIYTCIFILSLISGISFIAQKTMLRAMVEDDQTLVVKNSWFSSTEMFAEILGGVMGSFLIFLVNFESVVVILCVCLLFSTFIIFKISNILSDSYETPLLGAYKDVLRIIAHERILLTQIIFFCVFMVFGALLYGFLIAFVLSNFESISYAYTYYLLSAGVGAITGAKLVSFVIRGNLGKKLFTLFNSSFVLCAGSYVLFSTVRGFFVSLLVYFMYSLMVSILKNVHQGFVYSKFHLKLQEPAWGVLNIFWHLTILVSSFFGGILVDLYGINWVLNKGAYLAVSSVLLLGVVTVYNHKVVNSRNLVSP